MRFLVLENVCGVGAVVVIQVCGEVSGSGGGFDNVVLGMSVVFGKSVILGMSMILTMGLGLACRGSFDDFGDALGMVLLGFSGACCDRHCLRRFFDGFR